MASVENASAAKPLGRKSRLRRLTTRLILLVLIWLLLAYLVLPVAWRGAATGIPPWKISRA